MQDQADVSGSAGSSPRLAYSPGLDGIRAVAVLAVIGFHSGIPGLSGGYYGVDAFFALSGYLITSLLVVESARSGTITLRRFWARRARRLLPALYVLVAAIGLLDLVRPQLLGAPHLVGGTLATLFYSANWYFIATHASYFAAIAHPSPLLHTWSLAIEEQFYLLWPLVVLAVLRVRFPTARRAHRPVRGPGGVTQSFRIAGSRSSLTTHRAPSRRTRLQVLFVLCATGALGSAIWMAVLTPLGSDTARAYYGTDTRAQSLLVGAALAVGVALWGPARRRSTRRTIAVLGVVGACGTGVLWAIVPQTAPIAFHGGFLVAGILTALVVLAVTQVPRSPVAALLSSPPLRAVGRISYGAYLWYWPLILLLSPTRTHLTGVSLYGLRVAATLSVATVSYVAIEKPVRTGALSGRRIVAAAPAALAGALGVVLLAASSPFAAASPPRLPAGLSPSVSAQGPSGADGPASSPARALGSTGPGMLARRVVPLATTPSLVVASRTRPARPLKVLLVGDSIAGSLGVGLAQEAPAAGIELVNEGSPGCSLGMDQQVQVLWYRIPPGPPCRTGDPAALLAQWKRWVDAFNPDVVLYVARGDLFNQQVGGRWEHLGQPAYDRYLAGRFAQAVSVLGSRGAAVVLATSPAYDSGLQPSGAAWPEDTTARVRIDDTLIFQAAARADAGSSSAIPPVTVVDLGSAVSPGGRYQAVVGGIPMRCSDGVHFTAAAGRSLAPRLFPDLVALGGSHSRTSPAGAWPGPLPPVVPSWWQKLPCAASGSGALGG